MHLASRVLGLQSWFVLKEVLEQILYIKPSGPTDPIQL